jgi:hypothetical protein
MHKRQQNRSSYNFIYSEIDHTVFFIIQMVSAEYK